jgi:hypothetical protein
MTDRPPEDPPEDPPMDEIVEDAVTPWRPLLPPDVFELMRLRVAAALAAHPVGSLLMRAARPDVVTDESARVETETGQPAKEAPEAERRKGSA